MQNLFTCDTYEPPTKHVCSIKWQENCIYRATIPISYNIIITRSITKYTLANLYKYQRGNCILFIIRILISKKIVIVKTENDRWQFISFSWLQEHDKLSVVVRAPCRNLQNRIRFHETTQAIIQLERRSFHSILL